MERAGKGLCRGVAAIDGMAHLAHKCAFCAISSRQLQKTAGSKWDFRIFFSNWVTSPMPSPLPDNKDIKRQGFQLPSPPTGRVVGRRSHARACVARRSRRCGRMTHQRSGPVEGEDFIEFQDTQHLGVSMEAGARDGEKDPRCGDGAGGRA